jgi:hypothetical protein
MIQKRKRGRPKTGKALTRVEITRRYRERQYAKIKAEHGQPTIDEVFKDALTMDEMLARVSPQYRAELLHEAALEEAQQDDGDDY